MLEFKIQEADRFIYSLKQLTLSNPLIFIDSNVWSTPRCFDPVTSKVISNIHQLSTNTSYSQCSGSEYREFLNKYMKEALKKQEYLISLFQNNRGSVFIIPEIIQEIDAFKNAPKRFTKIFNKNKYCL